MELQKAWGRKLDNMRNAAASDPQHAAQACPYSMVSGFTPVNPAGAQHPVKLSLHANGASSSKRGKAKPPTRRNDYSSAMPKARKATNTRILKNCKTAGELQVQDISKGLPRTKPEVSSNDALLMKIAAPSELVLSQPRHDSESSHDAWADLEHYGETRPPHGESHSSGLADKYQVAFARQAHTNILPKLVSIEAETDSSMGNRLLDVSVHNFEDFLVPASAQGENHEDPDNTFPTKGGLIPLPIVTEKAFNSDEIFGDQDEVDEFSVNDEGLEEFMQSIDPAEVHKERAFPDWQPKHFNDDPLEMAEFDENVHSDAPVPAWSNPQSQGNNALLPRYCDNFDDFEDDELDEELIIAMSDQNVPESSKCQSEGNHAENPNLGIDSDREEHYQDTYVLGDGLNPAASHGFIDPSSRILSQVSGNVRKVGADHAQENVTEEDDDRFEDDEMVKVLLDTSADGSDFLQPQTPLTSPEKPPSSPKLQRMPSKTYTPTKSSGILLSSIDVPQKVSVNRDALPFIRPPFPKPIRDRSPILGLTNHTVLRTSFRIGEALNAAAAASRANTDAIIELYARIVSSEREPAGGFKRAFQIGDLFTDKPPYLNATYSLWKGVDLWDADSKPFLGENGKGKMARVMGRIKRRAQGGGCEMVVLSIWEVDWEDVEVAKGIVCS